MIIVDDISNSDRKLIYSGIAEKLFCGIDFLPYYSAQDCLKFCESENEYLNRCDVEIHCLIEIIKNRFPHSEIVFSSHQCSLKVDCVAEKIENLLSIVNEYPARWTYAELHWNVIENHDAVEEMAKRICDSLQDSYVYIGHRNGKLSMNANGEFVFRKRNAKRYGFIISASDLCREFILNHKYFLHKKGKQIIITKLDKASEWH